MQENKRETALACLPQLARWRADDYETWVQVGMILKDAGCSVQDWDSWSRASDKWKPGCCERKWNSFNGGFGDSAIGIGSLVEWVKQDGGTVAIKREQVPGHHALSWDSELGPHKAAGLKSGPAPDWQPNDLIRYLKALFRPDDIVGYVMRSWQGEDGRYLPTKGRYGQTCGQIIERLEKYGQEIDKALGDWTPEAGAWIRVNPLDGQGVRNDNVTDLRHVLVESDSLPVEKQLEIIKRLRLPCAAVVHSAGKSIHAIVRIDAGQDRKLYSKRVYKLYEMLKAQGFDVDRQNRNPARLSRMPSIKRNGKPQHLISGPCGPESWAEWEKAEQDNELVLPDVFDLADFETPRSNDPNELLRRRFLCRGGGLLFVGPTGIGKSSCIMQACCRWAIGQPFFGIEPNGELRSLIIQAENDNGDIAEIRDGIFSGLKSYNELLPEDPPVIAKRIKLVCEDSRTGEEFGLVLDRILHRTRTDLVIIDPALAYLGGDALKQADVTKFLRNIINPILHKHQVGLILVHHTNKPPKGEEARDWRAGELAYLGQGAADWANWARGVFGLQGIGSHSVFKMVLGKRGGRIGWKSDEGEKLYCRHIAHAKEDGIICWREADDEEVFETASSQVGKGRKAQPRDWDATALRYIEIIKTKPVWRLSELQEHCSDQLAGTEGGISKSQYKKHISPVLTEAQADGKIFRAKARIDKSDIWFIGPDRHAVEGAAKAKQQEIDSRKEG